MADSPESFPIVGQFAEPQNCKRGTIIKMVACPWWLRRGPFLLTWNWAISVCLSYAGCFQVTKVQTILVLLEFSTKHLFNMWVIIGLTHLFTFPSASWHIICFLLCCRFYDLLMNFSNLEYNFSLSFFLKERRYYYVWSHGLVHSFVARLHFSTSKHWMFLEMDVSQFWREIWTTEPPSKSPRAAFGKIIWSIV